MSLIGSIVGGAVTGLLGSRGSSGRTSTQTTENRRSTVSGTVEETSQLLSEEELQVLRAFLPMIGDQAQQLTRTQALQDVQGFSDRAIRQLREQGIPQLFAQQAQAGGYAGSMVSLLGNDLTARTAENIAAAGVEAVTRYSGAQSDLFANVSQIASILRGAVSTSTRTAQSTERSQGTSSGTGTQSAGQQNPFLAALAGGLQGFNNAQSQPETTTKAPGKV